MNKISIAVFVVVCFVALSVASPVPEDEKMIHENDDHLLHRVKRQFGKNLNNYLYCNLH